MEVYQDHSFQVDSHSVPNAPMGIIKHVYQERVKGLGQKWDFLKMGAKSSTKHVSGGKVGLHLGPNNEFCLCYAGMPIHTLTQEPGT